MRYSLAFALIVVSSPLSAQTINPGMTKAQVVAELGNPATLRTVSDYTYIFYTNKCGKKCGMNDLVVLHRDSVVDAIFRSPDRHYTGKSSSPSPISPEAARKEQPTVKTPPATAPDSGKLRRPAPPNDVHPSIPTNRPSIRPLPTNPPKNP